MQEIGAKIKEIRKRKGLSQEELADYAKVNLRTIQRIENNENEPRGKTLNLICEVLETNVEDLLDYGKTEDNIYLIFFHLSVLVYWVLPLGNVILPLILWLNKRDKIVGLKEIGSNVLNFQIVWSVVANVMLLIFAYLKLNSYSYAWIALYCLIAVYLSNIILPIIFAYKTAKGRTNNYYPVILRLIK